MVSLRKFVIVLTVICNACFFVVLLGKKKTPVFKKDNSIISHGFQAVTDELPTDFQPDVHLGVVKERIEMKFGNIPSRVQKNRVGSNPYRKSDKKQNEINKRKSNDSTFLITWYDHPRMHWVERGTNEMDFGKCEYSNCVVSLDVDKNLHEKSNVVIYHGTALPPVIPKKHKYQKWIFYTLEPPSIVHEFKDEWNNQFDWIMNYREDSDIYLPYSTIHKNLKYTEKNFTEIIKKKQKFAAWMVSDCKAQSKRKLYIEELKKYIPIDVFGACAGGRVSGIYLDVYRKLASEYKFFLAFENSFCKDYVTEKAFFHYFPDVDMIPVVRGSGPYNKILPNGTYISTADFKSPKDLAKYLKILDKNDSEYEKFLQRQQRYVGLSYVQVYQNSLCELCNKLNSEPTVSADQSPKNITEWLITSCTEPTDLNFI